MSYTCLCSREQAVNDYETDKAHSYLRVIQQTQTKSHPVHASDGGAFKLESTLLCCSFANFFLSETSITCTTYLYKVPLHKPYDMVCTGVRWFSTVTFNPAKVKKLRGSDLLMHTVTPLTPKLKFFSSRLSPIDWSQLLSREWRCSWSSADRLGSEWSTVLLSTRMRFILEVWRYFFAASSHTNCI